MTAPLVPPAPDLPAPASPAAGRRPFRIALYSHDAQGLGHIRRHHLMAAALAGSVPALVGAPVTGLVISGTAAAGRMRRPDGWDLLTLPAFAKDGTTYAPRHLDVDAADLGGLRTAVLTAALTAFAPDLLVVDKHAAGLRGELLPALAALSAAGTRIVLGLRDILDDAMSARSQWQREGTTEVVERYYDRLWVYGDPRLHSLFDSGELPHRFRPMADFTGYLAPAPSAVTTRPGVDTEILTMVGGGADGYEVAAAAAAAPVPEGYTHLVCTGPYMPVAQAEAVRAVAGPRTHVVGYLDEAAARIPRSAAVVIMGGYNSVCEVLPTTTPALVVPRCTPRREQLVRALALAEGGVLDSCTPEELTPGLVGRWFDRVLTPSARAPRTGIDLDGATRVGHLAAAQLTARALAPTGDGGDVRVAG